MTESNDESVLRRKPLLGFFAALGTIALLGLLILPGVDALTLGLTDQVRSNLASALIGGAVIGVALLGAEMAFAWQLSQIEHTRAGHFERMEEERRRHSKRENLRLQLGLGKDFPRIDLSDQDLSRFYLHQRDFSGAILNGVNLEGAVLLLTNLSDAMLIESNLKHAFLGGANLTHATLYGANLTGAILINTDLTDAGLHSADLTGTLITGAIFTGSELEKATVVDVRWDPEDPPRWPEGFSVPTNSWNQGDPRREDAPASPPQL